MMKKHNAQQEKHFLSGYKITIILAMMNIAITAILLMLMTHTDNQSTTMANYSASIAELNIQNQVLEEKIAQSQSIVSVTQRAAQLGMEPVSNIVYLNTSNVIAEHVQ